MRLLPVKEIVDGIYLLDEFGGTNCYLVVGSEKALLIDCGTGFADLKGTVESLTALPVEVIATHGHVDHIGGAGAFEKIYIHKDDTGFINKIQFSLPARKLFTAMNGAAKSQGVKLSDVKRGKYRTKFIPIDESFSLDLGNRKIKIKHTPGHTKGSIAVIDETDKIIFSGDNVCDALWLHLVGSLSIEEWLPSAQWLYEKSKEYRVFWGHRNAELTSDFILQVISWGKEIMAFSKKNAFPSRTKQYPETKDGILYKTGRVFKK
ncbi:MAG: MBL fold metallo-hydrolase [Ruminococcaceae bacterium]|nr:MBL fold metallo-hydrolase [Oscillospiraceae bacterium]